MKKDKKCKCSIIKEKMLSAHTWNTLVEIESSIEVKEAEIRKLREIIRDVRGEIRELEVIRHGLSR